MFKKSLSVYILLLFTIIVLIFPVFSLAFDQDSIYVWSNISSVSTSILSTTDEQEKSINPSMR